MYIYAYTRKYIEFYVVYASLNPHGCEPQDACESVYSFMVCTLARSLTPAGIKDKRVYRLENSRTHFPRCVFVTANSSLYLYYLISQGDNIFKSTRTRLTLLNYKCRAKTTDNQAKYSLPLNQHKNLLHKGNCHFLHSHQLFKTPDWTKTMINSDWSVNVEVHAIILYNPAKFANVWTVENNYRSSLYADRKGRFIPLHELHIENNNRCSINKIKHMSTQFYSSNNQTTDNLDF